MDKNKKKLLDGVVSQINKSYGSEVVLTGAEAVKQGRLTKRVIKTPSLELNEALWCGGLCGIVELFGPQSSGKTSLMLDTIAMNQKEDPDFLAAWLETEGSVNETILADHNIDLERLVFIRQEDLGNAESSLDVVRGLINRENLLDLIVVNSVAGLSPKKETEDDLEKQNIALIARTMSKFFRVAGKDLAKNKITAVFINQMRENVGQMYGDPATTTGGKALGYYASQRIRMSQNKIMAADPIKEDEGVKIAFITKKNRFAGKHTPFTKGCYYATYANGIDSTVSMPQVLLDAGIVRCKGSWWYYEDSDGNTVVIDGIEGKFNSKAKFVQVLRENDKWREEMLSQIQLSQEQTEEEAAQSREENAKLEEEGAAMEETERQEMVDSFNEMFEGQQ